MATRSFKITWAIVDGTGVEEVRAGADPFDALWSAWRQVPPHVRPLVVGFIVEPV